MNVQPKRLRDGHVWIYASDVLNDAGAQPGALVHVVGPKDKMLGSAIYSSSSQIKLRLLGREVLRIRRRIAASGAAAAGRGRRLPRKAGA